ncbi:hypothetical protein [Brachybacterium phenoliresistens]|uniref:Uncharacterized protein n=1 Tax=Brachybacterium phenoliresistens TaxID=396014 RepID=Z9JS44_9MICO|nr:hypothetical protein [Brachybacterium phenoliresistens]EWS80626.1 hypothetical protein BF93_02790 [Brachybacterium phenoliresistens]
MSHLPRSITCSARPSRSTPEWRSAFLIDRDDVLVTDLESRVILAESTIDRTRGHRQKKQGPGKNRGPAS